MDSQTQLAENNDQVLDEVLDDSPAISDSSTTPVEANLSETDNGIVSDPVTDQSIADSIQASLENEPTDLVVQSPDERYSAFWTGLVDSWREFSQSSRPLLINLAWVVAALVVLRILAAIVSAVNSTPLLSPLFQLIGAGYTVWFINRYLLKQATRQELAEKIRSITGQTLGRSSNADLVVSNDLTVRDSVMLEE
jgi:hypothetical protein